MTPATAKKGAARYRYYVSAAPNQGRKRETGLVARLSAPEIEAAAIKALKGSSGPSAELADEALKDTDGALVEQHLERVTIYQNRLDLSVWDTEASASRIIVVPRSGSPSTRNRQIILPK